MPSPFPGMNPFLEQNDSWQDFHNSCITHMRDMLSVPVGDKYLVKIEVRLYIHELSAEERRFFGQADVGVMDTRRETSTAGTATLTAPMRLTLPRMEIERHARLEIRDRRGREIITVIELLSPANKRPGEDQTDYLAKRSNTLACRANLVEIDLLRGGERPRPPEIPPCDYYVLVSRAREWPHVDFWPVSLRERLPVIPIPLAASDPDIPLDLQALLDRTYDAAGYGKYIYGERPEPPLSPADEEWARQFIPNSAVAQKSATA